MPNVNQTQEEPATKTNNKKGGNKIVLAVVAVAVIGVIIYAVAGGKKPGGNKGGLKDPLMLTAENICFDDAAWELHSDGNIHALRFEDDGTFCYDVREEDSEIYSPFIVATDNNYSIEENNVLSLNYEIDMEEFSEKYAVQLNTDTLILTAVKDSGDKLAGTYKKVKDGEDSGEDSDKDKTSKDTGSKSQTETGSKNQSTDNSSKKSGSSSSAKNGDNGKWKKLYSSYIDSMAEEGYTAFNLIYIDDDDIPELYMHGEIQTAGDRICTYRDGKIEKLIFPGIKTTSYVPESGFVKNESKGNDGLWHFIVSVYSLNDGKFTQTFDGVKYLNDDYDKTRNFYYLNGVSVGYSEFESALSSHFDHNVAIGANLGEKSRDDILKDIKNLGVK